MSPTGLTRYSPPEPPKTVLPAWMTTKHLMMRSSTPRSSFCTHSLRALTSGGRCRGRGRWRETSRRNFGVPRRSRVRVGSRPRTRLHDDLVCRQCSYAGSGATHLCQKLAFGTPPPTASARLAISEGVAEGARSLANMALPMRFENPISSPNGQRKVARANETLTSPRAAKIGRAAAE
jgi:hypothetical protein